MEAFSFMATPKMMEVMTEAKIGFHNSGHFDLAKMNKEQYLKFRHHFIDQRMYNPVLMANKNDQAMDLLLNCLCLIMCKKVPTDLGVNKADQLHLRVKMFPRPADAEDKPTSAVLRLTPVKRPGSTKNVSPDETIDSFMGDVDQDGKAVAMNGRAQALPYQVPVINQIAARHVREDFVHFMVKHVPDFFKDEGHPNIKKILSHSDKQCMEREDAFI
jgi:hypothetical protein